MRLSVSARRLLLRSGVAQAVYRSAGVKRLYRWIVRDRLGDRPNLYNIQLSSICNALCVFCPYPMLKDSGTAQLHISDVAFEHAVALMRKEPRPIVSFTPTTGEVLANHRWAERIQVVLDLPFVEEVYFYSNAISLDDKNVDRLLALRNRDKLRINFSTGGADRALYKTLYGVDRFDRVAKNLNGLFEALVQRTQTVPVAVDVKLRPGERVPTEQLVSTYNKAGYRYAHFIQSNELSDLGGIIPSLYTIRPKLEARRKRPCHGLRNVRFAANGDLWLCGCAFSEPPGSTQLRAAKAGEWIDLSAAKAHYDALATAWRDDDEVPSPCRSCPVYQPEPTTAAPRRRLAVLSPSRTP